MNFLKEHFKKILFFLTILILLIMIGLSSIGRLGGADLGFFGNMISGFQKIVYKTGNTLTNIPSMKTLIWMVKWRMI
jgi:hypothetical protein